MLRKLDGAQALQALHTKMNGSVCENTSRIDTVTKMIAIIHRTLLVGGLNRVLLRINQCKRIFR